MRANLPVLTNLTRPAAVTCATIVAVCAAVGCGGSNWPRVVEVAPENMYDLTDATAGERILLPDATPFAVHDRESRQDPGQGGTARGESDAKPDGTAYCRATGSAGGSASGDFLVGHVFHNSRTQAATAVCKVRIEFAQTLSMSPGADPLTVANYSLEAIVRDSSERILRRYPLADSSTALGPRTSAESAEFDLEFEMQPRTAYHVLLAGRVNSSSKPETEAAAEIEVKRFQMEVTMQTAGAAASQPVSASGG